MNISTQRHINAMNWSQRTILHLCHDSCGQNSYTISSEPFLHKNVRLQNIAICYSLPLHIPHSCGIRRGVVQVKWAFEQKSLQCDLSAHPASTQHYHIWQPICFLKPSDVVVSEFAYNPLSRWGKCVYHSVSDTAGSLSEGNLLEAMLDVKKLIVTWMDTMHCTIG